MLTQEYLKQILDYDPETGDWVWKMKRCRNGYANAGSRAGYLHKTRHSPRGFWLVKIKAKQYYLSRLAFLYMEGRFPDPNAVHINLDTSDDRWENLKEGIHQVHPYKDVKPHNKRLASLEKKSKLPMGVFVNNSPRSKK